MLVARRPTVGKCISTCGSTAGFRQIVETWIRVLPQPEETPVFVPRRLMLAMQLQQSRELEDVAALERRNPFLLGP